VAFTDDYQGVQGCPERVGISACRSKNAQPLQLAFQSRIEADGVSVVALTGINESRGDGTRTCTVPILSSRT
jgi:hypothetical protein